jgi:hypothetical protein
MTIIVASAAPTPIPAFAPLVRPPFEADKSCMTVVVEAGGVGVVIAALDATKAAEVETEEAVEGDVEELAAVAGEEVGALDVKVPSADEEVGALDAKVLAVAADEDADDAGAGVLEEDDEASAALEDEPEFEPPTGAMTPPCTVGEPSEAEVPCAFCL